MHKRSHTPVLADEVISLLVPRTGGRYIDATLGAGGHTQRLLEESAPSGHVLAIDRDTRAHEMAKAHLGSDWQRVTPVHGSFGQLATIARDHEFTQVDGILADLGISSMQVDEAERGFSFSKSGPVDMRMNPDEGERAIDLLRRISAVELKSLLSDLGEERYSARIANVIKEAVRADRIDSTTALADIVADAVPAKAKRHLRIHPATKTFQALRIAVNDELGELDRLLASALDILAPGGCLAIIAFHSLEDRRVKRRFREWAWSSSLPPDLAAAAGERSNPLVKILTKRPIVASEAETARNPRARSAKLRACQKLEPQ